MKKRTIFESLDLAWELLRIFKKESLKKISPKVLDIFYPRGNANPNLQPPQDKEEKDDK